jgi:hypothetical protein
MGKTMQMPTEFVTDVYALLLALTDTDLDAGTRAICKRLEGQIQAKIAAVERREAFTAYKVAPDGSAEREKYRLEYLDKAGVHQDWRTGKETHL